MPFDNPHEIPFGDIEILRDARRRISSRRDWVQGCFRDGDRHCLVAALSIASGSRSFRRSNQTERRLARLLARQLPETAPFWAKSQFVPARQRLMWFNDNAGTHHTDVMALFDRTIAQLACAMPVVTVG
jgi:hypothetical protein